MSEFIVGGGYTDSQTAAIAITDDFLRITAATGGANITDEILCYKLNANAKELLAHREQLRAEMQNLALKGYLVSLDSFDSSSYTQILA